MRLAIGGSDLARALSRTGFASHLRLEARQGEVRIAAVLDPLQGRRAELRLEARVKCTVARRGVVVLDGGALRRIARHLSRISKRLSNGGEVTVATEGRGRRLDLAFGRWTFSIPTSPAKEFPVMAEGKLPHRFAIDAAELRRILDTTRLAISTEETRFFLNGIYLHAVADAGVGLLRAVTTDGHRLARVEIALPQGAADMPGVIVPRKAVAELGKLIKHGAGAVAIALSKSHIRFSFAAVTLTSELIDGTFPDTNRVIPSGNDKILDVDRAALLSALRAGREIVGGGSPCVRLSLGKGRLRVSMATFEGLEVREELEVSYEAPPLDIGFNCGYLIDALAALDGDTVRLTFSHGQAPVLATEIGDEPSSLQVVMPMRLAAWRGRIET